MELKIKINCILYIIILFNNHKYTNVNDKKKFEYTC